MLRHLELLPVYDSAEHNLVLDLIVPLLENSIGYLRGVGYFTSGWLRAASEGMSTLVENGGHAQIIVSPILEKNDWEAFQLGLKAQQDEVLKKVLSCNMEDLAESLERNTLNTLAWMIADGLLEFRFAVPRPEFAGGDYHDKVAVFQDADGDRVAIHGSFNDSAKGLLNGEAFSVFVSWNEVQAVYVERHHQRLLSLWGGTNAQFNTFTIPEAIKQQFIRVRSTAARPYNVTEDELETLEAAAVAPSCPIELRPYQQIAIQRWLENNCQGVFEMATGTGKTYTALAAATNRFSVLKRLALVIFVPYLHLLEQWAQHCRGFGFRPILCSSAHEKWHWEVLSRVQDLNAGFCGHLCLIAVHRTGSMERFWRSIGQLRCEDFMIVADEVHALGAPELQRALLPNATMRLGLSATPRRWFDPLGTDSIFNYFGKTCFEYPLNEAIGTYLTPYEYHPVLCSLEPAELAQYGELTTRICALYGQDCLLDEETRDRLRRLLLERARIIWNASAKVPELLRVISELRRAALEQGVEPQGILVYCAPGRHREVLLALSRLGLRCHEFVHSVSLSERQRLIHQFAEGDIQVLVAIKCLDEGVDIPSIQTAFLLAGTTNPRELIQRRGRILRLFPGKSRAHIYDFVVVPPEECVSSQSDLGASILRREMPRFAEFSSAAINEFASRATIRGVLDRYEMLNHDVKANAVGRQRTRTQHELMRNVRGYLRRHQGRPQVVQRCFHHPQVQYAAL